MNVVEPGRPRITLTPPAESAGGVGVLAVNVLEESTFRSAITALNAGKLKDAEPLLRAVLGMRPTHLGALNLLGVVLMQLGQLAEAESFLRRALQQQRASDVTLYNYGLVLKALERPAEALERFTQALKINSRVAETWNSRGTVFNDLKRYQDAVGDFDKAIAIDSRYADAFCNKGKSLTMLERFEEALSAYASAIALKPDLAEAWLGRGNVDLELKQYSEALAAYEKALALSPSFAEAYCARGRAFGELDRYGDALAAFGQALALKPQLAEAWLGRGNICRKLKQHENAFAAYDTALRLNPKLTDASMACGDIFTELKQYGDAVAAYERVIAVAPDRAEAWLGRGNGCEGLGRHDEALAAFDRSLALKPNFAEAWCCRGIVLFRLKRYEEAIAPLEQALMLKPDLADAWVGRGDLASQRKQYAEAFAAFEQALTLNPNLAGAWLGRGNVLYDIRADDVLLDPAKDGIGIPDYTDIIAAYDRALALKPDLAEAWLGRGNVLWDQQNHREAESAYDQALALKPDLAEAWLGRGNVLHDLSFNRDAQSAFDRALALKPELVKALSTRGNVFIELREYDRAVADFDQALALDSDLKYAEGQRLYAKLHLADWTNLDVEISAIASAVAEDKPTVTPFIYNLISASPSDQLMCAQRFTKNLVPFPALRPREAYAHDRIRIAYLSRDFRNHPVAQLMVGLFEQHDRSRFHTVGLSFGPEEDSSLYRRLKSAFDEFIDVRQMSDEEIAHLILKNEIDIAIDLMGYTSGSRINVLARRPAPIQVNYLGYPGTMAADFIDYILADRTIIPEEHFSFYTEQVIWLPDCFQVNDGRRDISERRLTRAECQLPETAFVFCCFNNAAKILPAMFDVWMRLLAARDDSVLWLPAPHPVAAQNLCHEVKRRGISPDRLIFAAKTPLLADHLARLRNADLFLDTLPYNAHTTASDALWAGVPLITTLGSNYASRVAASVLEAVGLADLITSSVQDYEALALELANDPDRLRELRERLARNRTAYPLFDTTRFTRHVESAYTTMWRRYQNGEGPQAFAVSRITELAG